MTSTFIAKGKSSPAATATVQCYPNGDWFFGCYGPISQETLIQLIQADKNNYGLGSEYNYTKTVIKEGVVDVYYKSKNFFECQDSGAGAKIKRKTELEEAIPGMIKNNEIAAMTLAANEIAQLDAEIKTLLAAPASKAYRVVIKTFRNTVWVSQAPHYVTHCNSAATEAPAEDNNIFAGTFVAKAV